MKKKRKNNPFLGKADLVGANRILGGGGTVPLIAYTHTQVPPPPSPLPNAPTLTQAPIPPQPPPTHTTPWKKKKLNHTQKDSK